LTGNVVISEADDIVYVVLSKEENYVHYGELFGTAECVKLFLSFTFMAITNYFVSK
jgi:glycine cleavage system H lipoate-binding protein